MAFTFEEEPPVIPYRDDADLRAWRARLRLTQEQAGARFGVAKHVYNYWEKGSFPRDLGRRWLEMLKQ